MARPSAPDRLRRPVRVACAAAGASLLGLALSASGAAAATGSAAYYATGNADGVRISVVERGYLLVETLADVGAPTAQASVSSTQNSGYAGYPWPGSAVLGLQGTANGAAGMTLQPYPVAVVSDDSHRHAAQTYGPVSLASNTLPNASTASSSGGVASATASVGWTSASVDVRHEASGAVSATAATEARGVDIGGVLQVGAVTATATATATLDGPIVRRSAMTAVQLRIAGQLVGLTDRGLVLAGTTTPIPFDNPLAATLRDQGITVAYVAAQSTPDGVISAGVRITVVETVPTLPTPVQVEYVLGRATVGVRAGGSDGVTPSQPGTTGPGASAPVGGRPGTAAVPGTPDLPGTPGALDPPVLDPPPGVPVLLATPATPVVIAAPVLLAARTTVGRRAPQLDLSYFYLVLTLGGVAVVGGASIIRLFGVRLAWSS